MSFSRERDMAPMVTAWLEGQGMMVLAERMTLHGCYCDLMGCRLDPEMVARREAGMRGWRPLSTHVVAVELKLDRIDEALRQCNTYRYATSVAYAAFPVEVAERVLRTRSRWPALAEGKIGLLGVTPLGVEWMMEPWAPSVAMPEWVARQAEKFWRERKRLWREAGR